MIKIPKETSSSKILGFFKKRKLFEFITASKQKPLKVNQTKKKNSL